MQDFWGPVALATAYSIIIVWGQFRVIPWVITIWLSGSGLLYVLARAFGGQTHGLAFISAVVGYGLLPLILMAILSVFSSPLWPDLALPVKIIGVMWSSALSTSLLCHSELAEKRTLVCYPTALVYYFMASLQSGA